jgi:hypothetical protein
MSKVRLTLNLFAAVVFTLLVSSAAQAQATRTWVSGVGDDVNPCSRTAPCKTFAGAISKTAAGGEIDALDPGGFGSVTITKSIVIDGTTGQGFGSILHSGTQGVVINDSLTGSPNTIIVRLRNLSINGAGTTLGTNGIHFVSGSAVHVENCRIMNNSGDGIRVTTGTAARLIVENTTITQTGDAIEIAGAAAGKNAVAIDRCSFTRNNNGVVITNRADVAISNSVISLNNALAGSAGVIINGPSGGGVVDIDSTSINNNAVGVQPNAGNTIRLGNVRMTGNGNALNFNGGTIGSFQNNKIAGNIGGENFASLSDIVQQ